MRAWIAVLCVGAGLAGCSFVIETDNLATEDEESASDASAGFGGSDSGFDSPSSGGSGGNDASENDSSSQPDADSGAPDTGADVGRLGFCESLSPAPTMCADFDTLAFPSGFDQLTQWGVCDPTLDESDSESAPRSFLITTPALPTTTDQGAGFLFKAFQKPASSITIEFDARFETLTHDNWIYLAQIETEGIAGDAVYTFRVRQGEAGLSETMYPTAGGTEYGGHAVTLPPVGQWTHVRWTLTYSGATSFSNVAIDGVITGGGLSFDEYVGGLTVKAGLVFVQGPSGPSNVRIDNVVVDID